MKRRLENLLASYLTLFQIPPDAGVHSAIATNFRRNFIVNGLDGASWLFGASFISISAVLPVYARHITDSALVIGLIPALHDFLFYIPQLFLAPLVERLPRKYPLVLFLGVVERLPYMALPFAALWFDEMPTQTATLLFILPPLNDPDRIALEFPDIDLVIDGGVLPSSRGSTVVDLTASPSRIVRQGDGIWNLGTVL